MFTVDTALYLENLHIWAKLYVGIVQLANRVLPLRSSVVVKVGAVHVFSAKDGLVSDSLAIFVLLEVIKVKFGAVIVNLYHLITIFVICDDPEGGHELSRLDFVGTGRLTHF